MSSLETGESSSNSPAASSIPGGGGTSAEQSSDGAATARSTTSSSSTRRDDADSSSPSTATTTDPTLPADHPSASSSAAAVAAAASSSSVSSSHRHQHHHHHHHHSAPSTGDATAVTLLLSGWDRFGLAERVCYHFDLLQTLTAKPAASPHSTLRRFGSSGGDDRGGGGGSAAASSDAVRPGEKEGSDRAAKDEASAEEKKAAASGGGATVVRPVSDGPPPPKGSEKGVERSPAKVDPQVGIGSRQGPSSLPLRVPPCGVVSLLECIPTTPPGRQTRKGKRALKVRHREFNRRAGVARERWQKGGGNHDASEDWKDEEDGLCYQPPYLPLRVSTMTRVTFAYELTRIAFVLDASPSLTSTYGSWGPRATEDDAGVCCPLDRLGTMAKTYFAGLVRDVPVPILGAEKEETWRPEVAVTVLAVYPLAADAATQMSSSAFASASSDASTRKETSILVRDYRINDARSASILADRVRRWAEGEVECEIASRLSHASPRGVSALSSGSRGFRLSNEYPTSSLRRILSAAHSALESLPADGRPLAIVATDCRSLRCDSVVDVATDDSRVDVPVHVLDLSGGNSHSVGNAAGGGPSVGGDGGGDDLSSAATSAAVAEEEKIETEDQLSFLTHDIDGPSSFPLGMSDDSDALHCVCKATGGAFFDGELLRLAASTVAGQVPVDSPLCVDYYFAFRRRSVRPNALQWYSLFALSPISPISNSAWGILPPPQYIRTRQENNLRTHGGGGGGGGNGGRWETQRSFRRNGGGGAGENPRLHPSSSSQAQGDPFSTSDTLDLGAAKTMHSGNRNVKHDAPSHGQLFPSKAASRTTFSIYSLSPVRVKGILLLRILEGYRAKRYGQNTQDADKVSVHFTLPLESGTVLHYELSYVASPYHNPMVESAHVKIELSGDPAFVQAVKNDFIHHQVNMQRSGPSTIATKASTKLCKFLRWIRKEDCLESYMCPLEWGDKLSAESPFLRRLGTLTKHQRHRHFRNEQFDVLCVGGKVHGNDEGLLSEFIETDNGEEELFEALSEWSTQTIEKRRRYLKQIPMTCDNLTAYCVIDVEQSHRAERLFTVAIDFFEALNSAVRIAVLGSLKARLSSCSDVVVLPKQIVNSIPSQNSEPQLTREQLMIQNQYHVESWDLVKDIELLPLLTKRRNEIGNFWLLHSTNSGTSGAPQTAKFAKFVFEQGVGVSDASLSNLYLIQYQVNVHPSHVAVNMQMDTRRGRFFPLHAKSKSKVGPASLFHNIYELVKQRDQQCGRALRSRTNLLGVFHSQESAAVDNALPSLEDHATSVKRLLTYSSPVTKKLRFFKPRSGSANAKLAELTTSLMLSGDLETDVAKLSISPTDQVGDTGPGTWFLVQYDRHTISIVHFPLEEQAEDTDDEAGAFVHRKVTFFTVGISDLYCKKDDFDDDDSNAGHISEHLSVSVFADAVEKAHGLNYARAIYLALRSNTAPIVAAFDPGDFAYALSFCVNKEIADAFVTKENDSAGKEDTTETESKLVCLLRKLLSPIPVAGGGSYFYFHGDESMNFIHDVMEASRNYIPASTMSHYETLDESDKEESENATVEAEDDIMSLPDDETNGPTDLLDTGEHTITNFSSSQLMPPLFVTFSFDGEVLSTHDIASLSKSSNLTAYITVFEPEKTQPDHCVSATELPKLHSAVALELRSRLNAFVAEQTLERLRHVGPDISEVDLRTVMKCLIEADHVASTAVPIHFFVPKADIIVAASGTMGSEGDLEEGYDLLYKEIETDSAVTTKKTARGAFFVAETLDASSLAFWCFIQVKKRFGVVSIECFHPSGMQTASKISASMRDIMAKCVHRVNQLLILDSLHRTRTASRFLLPEDLESTSTFADDDHKEASWHSGPFELPPGHFGCPVQFQTLFPLYHRCGASQAIMKLESSVLHSFAVSNRRGVFVYKDESAHVFYMMLKSKDGEAVELMVFGVNHPGPSITEQLRRLLEKKLLSLSVDALSSVLTKNPRFSLTAADMSFLRTFEARWTEVDDSEEHRSQENDQIYEFPDSVYDPVLMLCYFRQNIKGSTFFHRLHDASIEDETQPDSLHLSDTHDVEGGITDGKEIRFEKNDFLLFYNNAPSPLDPNVAPTLTSKGSEYSRQAGNGIALIEFDLHYSDNSPVEYLNVAGLPKAQESVLDVPIATLRLQKVQSELLPADLSSGHPFRLRVRLINTTLNPTVIHKWVLLTLNQVLAAWVIERHLERSSLGLLSPPCIETHSPSGRNKTSRNKAIDRSCRGLPQFTSMMQSSVRLPHPAISKLNFRGTIKSTTLSQMVLDILEQAVIGPLFNKSGQRASLNDYHGISVMRILNGSNAKLVKLSHDSAANRVYVEEEEDPSKVVKDRAFESPEYLCFFAVQHNRGDTKHQMQSQPPASSFLFREVMVEHVSNNKPNDKALAELKASNPSVFSRSVAFVLSVTRSSRSLMTYNWNPSVLNRTSSRLREIEEATMQSENLYGHSQQARCLHHLNCFDSPGAKLGCRLFGRASSVAQGERKKESSNIETSTRIKVDSIPEKQDDDFQQHGNTERPGPPRKVRRPTVIRRPKLIGKSVEGGAAQAMAASRARASANRIKTPTTSSGSIAPKAAHRTPNIPASQSRDNLKVKNVRNALVSNTSAPSSKRTSLSREERRKVTMLLYILKAHHVVYTKRIPLQVLPKKPQPDMAKKAINSWANALRDREISALEMDLMLSHAACVWCGSCNLVQDEPDQARLFQAYFARTTDMMPLGEQFVPSGKSFESDSKMKQHSSMCHPMFLIRELRNFRACRLVFVMKISTVRRQPATTLTARFNVWLLTYAHDVQDQSIVPLQKVAPETRERKRKMSLLVSEQDSAQIDSFAADFCCNLSLESEVFNYSCEALKHSTETENDTLRPRIGPLIRQISSRFPLEKQRQMPNLVYRLHQKVLPLMSLRDQYIDGTRFEELYHYVWSHASEHSLVKSDGEEKCLSGSVIGSSPHALFFLMPGCHEKAFDMFVLCATEGRNMDDLVFGGKTPNIGETLSNKILSMTVLVVRNILHKSALSVRRDSLWTAFSMPLSRRRFSVSAEELQEICLMSFLTPIAELDSRLRSIVLDEENNLQIDWLSAFLSMQRDPVFSHFELFTRKGEAKTYAVYFRDEDVFLLFDVSGGRLKESNVLTRENSVDEVWVIRKKRVVEIFVNFLLHWVWHNI